MNPLVIPSIQTVAEYLHFLGSQSSSRTWIFRGQARNTALWPLVPKAGRREYEPRGGFTSQKWQYEPHLGYLSPWDMRMFSEWERSVCAFTQLPNDPWEKLALAQHHLLATRLMDWSLNPLVALFFTCCEEPGYDGVLIVRPLFDVVTAESFETISRVMIYKPRWFDRRIAAQQGLFTYHPHPSDPLQKKIEGSPGYQSFEIPIIRSAKQSILSELSWIGVSRAALFPDLEGVSWFVNDGNSVKPHYWSPAADAGPCLPNPSPP